MTKDNLKFLKLISTKKLFLIILLLLGILIIPIPYQKKFYVCEPWISSCLSTKWYVGQSLWQRFISQKNPTTNNTPLPSGVTNPDTSKPRDKNDEPVIEGENVFTLNTLKIGDKIGNMVVISINKVNPNYPGPPEKNYKIAFSGQVTISGHYDIFDKNPNDQINSDYQLVQFVPNPSSSLKLPKEKSDGRNGTFGFRDFELTRKMLAPLGKSGDVTVVIDNFTLLSYPSEGHHEADLIEIIQK